MKKKYILLVILLLICVTACKKDNIELEKSLSKMTLTGDLITKKVYYHNVAEYDGSNSNFFRKLLGIDKKAWIEYTGLVDLGIDLTQVKVTTEGKKIHVLIPKTKISKPTVKNTKNDDIVIYNSDGSILNLGEVSASEGTEAVGVAQTTMVESVQKDTQLLRMAQLRAKNVLEAKIKSFIEASDSSYYIEWEYADNIQS